MNEGEKTEILLRLLGATAIMVHCPKYGYLFKSFGRSLTDLDFATYSKFRGKLEKFFVNLGYRITVLDLGFLKIEKSLSGLSEIAAHAFVKRMLGLPFLPCVLHPVFFSGV